MRRTSGAGALLGFLTIAVVAMAILALARGGPDVLPPPPSPPVATAVPSVLVVAPPTLPIEASPIPSPQPISLDPPEPPVPPPGPCMTSATIREFASMTIGDVARTSQAVVVATVLEVGAARWDTVDTRMPDRQDRDAFHVVRLLRIHVDDVLSGHLDAVVVAIPGGSIGCWQFLMDETPSQIRPGERFVLVVRGVPHDPRLAGISLVSETWRFEGDRVLPRMSGPLTLAEFRASIAGR